MRKRVAIFFVILLSIAATAHAEWTITASVPDYRESQGKAIVMVDLTADASEVSFDLFDYLDARAEARVDGLYPYRLKTVPTGSVTAYTVTLSDALETATVAGRSATAAEVVKLSGYTTSGGYLSVYGGLQVDITSPGDGNQIRLYLECVQ